MDLEAIRGQFPVADRWVYLDNAGVAPLPTCVVDAVAKLMASRHLHGRAELDASHGALPERCRGAAAKLMGASASDIALVQNTSEGINVIAQGYPWRAGDNIVTANVEFPSNVYPWLNLERRGVEVRFVEQRGGLIHASDIEAAMDPRTRVLAMSHVEFVSGQVNDLEWLGALCRRRGVRFVVDAAQSLGVLALDVQALGIDALSTCGWKWLLGPLGTGLLYVAPTFLDELALTFVGPDSVPHRDPLHYRLTPRSGAARFEFSTRDLVAFEGLSEALALIDRVGIHTIQRRVQSHAARLRGELGRIGYDVLGGSGVPCSGIVSFRAAAWEASALADHFEGRGIYCIERCGYVRFSPHFYNTEQEIERAVAAAAHAWRG